MLPNGQERIGIWNEGKRVAWKESGANEGMSQDRNVGNQGDSY